jgi:hypothetical protein
VREENSLHTSWTSTVYTPSSNRSRWYLLFKHSNTSPLLLHINKRQPVTVQEIHWSLIWCTAMVHFRGWRISKTDGCNRHATLKASCQKSSSIFKNLTIQVSKAGMVQSELLLGYGLNDLEFESWQGQDFTKQTGSGAQPASYLMGTGVLFQR